jgi:hypothetical protein
LICNKSSRSKNGCKSESDGIGKESLRRTIVIVGTVQEVENALPCFALVASDTWLKESCNWAGLSLSKYLWKDYSPWKVLPGSELDIQEGRCTEEPIFS